MIDLVADRNAIQDLLASYALTLDANDVEACLDLFTHDGEFLSRRCQFITGRGLSDSPAEQAHTR
jgi:hypothetical protein